MTGLRWTLILAVLTAQGLEAQARALAFDGIPMRTWLTRVLDDSSNFRRDRAAAAIRRAPPAFRREFVGGLVPALELSGESQARALAAIGRVVNEGQFGSILEERGFDLGPAVPRLTQIAEERGNPNRRVAWFLLTRVDSVTRRGLLPNARAAMRDPEPGIRWQAVEFLARVRDSTDFAAVLAAGRDTSASVRDHTFWLLSRWAPRHAIPVYMDALRDTVEDVRIAAIVGLGRAGPAARDAVAALVRMVGDAASSRELRARAAWALSLVLPLEDQQNYIQVEVSDQGMGIRSDGLGPYVHGADSVSVTKAASLNLGLAGERGDGRATSLKTVRPLRRSLLVDLSRPVRNSGATARGVIRDNEAAVHMAFTHVHERTMISINRLEPSDTLTPVERVEVQFRIDGVAHVLQMGEWAQGEFNRQAPRINGIGTSTARVAHTDLSTWTVFAPEGSVARLWDFRDAQNPVDRGLYVVPFRFHWSLVDPP
jgi:hypothetical protein